MYLAGFSHILGFERQPQIRVIEAGALQLYVFTKNTLPCESVFLVAKNSMSTIKEKFHVVGLLSGIFAFCGSIGLTYTVV